MNQKCISEAITNKHRTLVDCIAKSELVKQLPVTQPVNIRNKNVYRSNELLLANNSLEKSSSVPDVYNNLTNRNVQKLFNPATAKQNRNTHSEENLLELIGMATVIESGHHRIDNINSCSYSIIKANSENHLAARGGVGGACGSGGSDLLASGARRLAALTDWQTSSATDLHKTADDNQDNSYVNGQKMMPPLQSSMSSSTGIGGTIQTDSQGLIVPKKLINPCLESSNRQNLHRELLFNQKVGKSVLNQKTELQRALQKQKERQMMTATANMMTTATATTTMSNGICCGTAAATAVLHKKGADTQNLAGELGRVIMQRAQRLESINKNTNLQDDQLNTNSLNPEYLNARAKLRSAIDTK